MAQVEWTCECGKAEAELKPEGKHILCYCKSCRAMVEKLGKGETLDPAGGSALLQVDPEGVTITKGAEHLRYMKLTDKGPLRWYAACCNTPMANTIGNRAFAFASFQVPWLSPKEALPPVSAKVNLKGATAHVPGPHGSAVPLITSLLSRSAKSWMTGTWKRHPFFTKEGKPIAARQDV